MKTRKKPTTQIRLMINLINRMTVNRKNKMRRSLRTNMKCSGKNSERTSS
jgi:hypothetical protein